MKLCISNPIIAPCRTNNYSLVLKFCLADGDIYQNKLLWFQKNEEQYLIKLLQFLNKITVPDNYELKWLDEIVKKPKYQVFYEEIFGEDSFKTAEFYKISMVDPSITEFECIELPYDYTLTFFDDYGIERHVELID